MAFSTLRKYSTQHGMSPTVQPSKGAGGGAPGASLPSGAAGGSKANDIAALGGMGAVGAGLLGKFAYDKYMNGNAVTGEEGQWQGPQIQEDGTFVSPSSLNNTGEYQLEAGLRNGGADGGFTLPMPSAGLELPAAPVDDTAVPGMYGKTLTKLMPGSVVDWLDKNDYNPLSGFFPEGF